MPEMLNFSKIPIHKYAFSTEPDKKQNKPQNKIHSNPKQTKLQNYFQYSYL